MEKPIKTRENPWFVYILRCADGTLYTGIAKDVEKRLAQHESGRGSKYLRGRLPLKVAYREKLPDRGGALQREAAIKKLPREEKQKLTRKAKKGRLITR